MPGVNFDMEHFRRLVLELGRLLNKKKIEKNHPIGISLNDILEYHKQKNYNYRDIQLGKLLLLIKHLTVIEKYDKHLLAVFRKKLKKITVERYYGERLEINTAATLIQKDIKFTKRESPDFDIFENSDTCHIECTSTHLTKNSLKNKDDIFKIKKAIQEKSKKPYCNKQTALFIDITNLFYFGLDPEQKDKLHDDIKKILQQSNYGSVLLFGYSKGRNSNTYNSNYNRIDNEKIGNKLSFFLDKHYPLGYVRVREAFFPGQG